MLIKTVTSPLAAKDLDGISGLGDIYVAQSSRYTRSRHAVVVVVVGAQERFDGVLVHDSEMHSAQGVYKLLLQVQKVSMVLCKTVERRRGRHARMTLHEACMWWLSSSQKGGCACAESCIVRL